MLCPSKQLASLLEEADREPDVLECVASQEQDVGLCFGRARKHAAELQEIILQIRAQVQV
jgi:L-asparaginase II